jgi:hypothetical protein
MRPAIGLRTHILRSGKVSTDLVQFPMLRTPFATDLERPTNVWPKVVKATALIGLI